LFHSLLAPFQQQQHQGDCVEGEARVNTMEDSSLEFHQEIEALSALHREQLERLEQEERVVQRLVLELQQGT